MTITDTPTVAQPYRVLSLDGGGVRGIYTAAFLQRLTTQFATAAGVKALDLGKGFDLITGTSTGAIVGCALAVGRPMDDVIKLYRDNGPKIFPHRLTGRLSAIYRTLMGDSFVKSGDQALRDALSKVLCKTTMADVYRTRGISLSIPAVAMNNHRSWVFKKTGKSGTRDDDYPLVDVCMASSAAPIYRSLASIKDPSSSYAPEQVFADGGLWANNPILVGLIDALINAPNDRPIEIFSLGTCSRPEGEFIAPGNVHRSMLGWWLGAKVAPLSIAAQEFAFDNMARFLATKFSELGRPMKHIRFPKKDAPAEMLAFLELDDTRDEAMNRLIQQAHSDADMTKSACDDPSSPDGALINRLMKSLPEMKTPQAMQESAA